jgi:formylglycine-generating enzyme required for sulfatase activity
MQAIRASFPLNPIQAQAVQDAYAASRQLPVDWYLPLQLDLLLALRLIPPGEFMVGLQPDQFALKMSWSPVNDEPPEDYLPPHPVQVDTPFYLGRCPVTQAQWRAVMGTSPFYFAGEGELPAENISPLEIDAFCQRLAGQTGRRVRLPSEADWEYACRAG